MILTGRQIREGRTLAGLSQDDLATAAEVVVGLIVRVEAEDGMAMAKKPDLAAIQGALETAGVEFIPNGGEGAGVRLRTTDKGEANTQQFSTTLTDVITASCPPPATDPRVRGAIRGSKPPSAPASAPLASPPR